MAYNIMSKYLQKLPSFSAIEICLSRSLVGVLVLFIILRINKLKLFNGFGDSSFKWLVLRGSVGVFFFATYTYSIG
jgi:hypothetical protein